MNPTLALAFAPDMSATARRAAEAAEIACESFLAAHAEPLPPALTVESAMAAETFAHGSDAALGGRCSGIGPADMFATFYTPEGVPLATYQRPARFGDSGPFKGLFRLALTDGRVIAASRNVLTVQGVRRALADYAAATGEGVDADESRESSAERLAELARDNLRTAADESSMFRAPAVGRAARLARRAGCQIARMIARANARKAAAEAAEIAPEADPMRPEMNWPAVTVTAEPGRLTAEGFKADAPAAEYRPQPCQQQQSRHTPTAAERAALARRMGDAIQRGIDARHGARVWGFAAVPAEMAAAFALAPVTPALESPLIPVRLTFGADVTAARLGRGEGFAELVDHETGFAWARDMIAI